MNKYIIGGIIGICITITVLSVWQMFRMNGRISQLENFAVEVAGIIRQAQQEVKK